MQPTPHRASPTRLLADAAKQAVRTAVRSPNRARFTWQFMAWTFVISQSLGHDGAWTDGWRYSSHGEDSDQAAQANGNADAPVYTSDAPEPVELASAGTAGDDASGYVPSGPGAEFHSDTVFSTPGGGAGPLPYLLHGGGDAGGYFGGDGGTPIYGGAPGLASGTDDVTLTPISTAYDGPPITFFQGLSPFSEKLGLGADPIAFAQLIPAGLQGPTNAAIAFTEDPLQAIPVWKSLGQLSATAQLKAGDSAHVHWLVQANGYNSEGTAQLQATNADSTHSIVDQTSSIETKTVSNTATLSDSHDWSGTMWVKGNYFEFNTIVQVNIVLNNDQIDVTRTGDGGVAGPSLINTGDNLQHNTAHILDVAPTAPAAPTADTTLSDTPHASGGMLPGDVPVHDTGSGVHQLVMGGSDQHFAVVQYSSLDQLDSLNFNYNDILKGNGAFAAPPKFADVMAGANDQANISDIWSGPQGAAPSIALDTFIREHAQSKTEYVNGDYYNFNTIVQINVTSDSNKIAKTLSGGMSGSDGGGGIIASGGNIQLNDATILKNDHSDDLFVAGKYTQYNLVLQVNALENSSTINQTSTVLHIGQDASAAHADDTSSSSAHANGDHNGANGSSVGVVLPSQLEELALRGGHTADTMM